MYLRDPGGILVALVIRRCVSATEAAMETAPSVGREVNVCVVCEAEG